MGIDGHDQTTGFDHALHIRLPLRRILPCARLAEMRKQLLISTESQAVPEANCDAGYPGDSASRDIGFGDDKTATQNEALPHSLNATIGAKDEYARKI